MASRAILRRRNIFSDYSILPVHSIQSILSHGSFDSHSFSSGASHFSQTTDHRKENDETSVLKKELLSFSNLGIFRHKACGSTSFHFGNGRLDFNCLLGVRLMSESTRYASTATAKKPDLGSDDEDKEVLAAKKESSPEECDQAVVGLSTAKAKAKAKKLQESHKVAKSILKRIWATLLGIGPALRAVASISREDWAKKLVHWKNEFVSTLNEDVND